MEAIGNLQLMLLCMEKTSIRTSIFGFKEIKRQKKFNILYQVGLRYRLHCEIHVDPRLRILPFWLCWHVLEAPTK